MSGLEGFGAVAGVLQLVEFCSRFRDFYAKVSEAPGLLLMLRKHLLELTKSLQQLENSLPYNHIRDASVLREIRADVRDLEIELDKVMPGPVDGKFRLCGKMFKYACRSESIKSAFDRLESRKNTLGLWTCSIMLETRERRVGVLN